MENDARCRCSARQPAVHAPAAAGLHDRMSVDQNDYFDLLCDLIEKYDRDIVPAPKLKALALLKHLLEVPRLSAVDRSRLLGKSLPLQHARSFRRPELEASPPERFNFAMTRDELLEKIRKVESLFVGTDSAGEADAALGALGRLQQQLETAPEEPAEFQFSLPDPWKQQLFIALVRRHGLKPYRLPRQRQTTIMVNLTRTQLDKVILPQFLELSKLLHTYLDEATRDIISQSVHANLDDATEQKQLPMG